jgi:ribosomal protein L12E/L44/L45/RPP1/RPP2
MASNEKSVRVVLHVAADLYLKLIETLIKNKVAPTPKNVSSLSSAALAKQFNTVSKEEEEDFESEEEDNEEETEEEQPAPARRAGRKKRG